VGILGGRPNHAIYFVGYRGDALLGLDPHTVFPVTPRGPAAKGSGSGQGPQPFTLPTATSQPPSDRTRAAQKSREARNSKDRTASTDSSGRSAQQTPYPGGANSQGESFLGAALSSFSAYSADTGRSSGSSATSAPFPSAEFLAQVHVKELVPLDLARLDPSLALGFYFPTRCEFEAFCEETRAAALSKQRAGRTPLYAVQPRAPSYMYSSEELDEDDEQEGPHEEGGVEGSAGVSVRRRSSDSTGSAGGLHSCSFDREEADDAAPVPGRRHQRGSSRRRSFGAEGEAGTGRRGSESSEDGDYVLV
jgi:hypothetical protein